MRDYDGDFTHWQKQLDNAGVIFDVTNLCGATESEIENVVASLIRKAGNRNVV